MSISSSPSSPSSPFHLFLLPLFLILPLLSSTQAGTWLSFNQNTGGMELADRLLGAPLPAGKSIADVVASGELAPEENLQLAGLVRMCRDRVKRSSGQRNLEHLDNLCAALLQLSKEQRRKRGRFSRFVPVQLDEDMLLW